MKAVAVRCTDAIHQWAVRLAQRTLLPAINNTRKEEKDMPQTQICIISKIDQELWVVGKVDPDNPTRWELQGVFSDAALAASICQDHWFVAPIELNMIYPEEPTVWPGAYYPTHTD